MAQSETDFTLGEDLYGVSILELTERIGVLRAEITRVEHEITKKTAERDAANDIFGKK